MKTFWKEILKKTVIVIIEITINILRSGKKKINDKKSKT